MSALTNLPDALLATILSHVTFRERFVFLAHVCKTFARACTASLAWNAADVYIFAHLGDPDAQERVAIKMHERGFRPRALRVYAAGNATEDYNRQDEVHQLDPRKMWSDVPWIACFGSSLTSLEIVGQPIQDVARCITFPEPQSVPLLEHLAGKALLPNDYNMRQVARFGASLRTLRLGFFHDYWQESAPLLGLDGAAGSVKRLAEGCTHLMELDLSYGSWFQTWNEEQAIFSPTLVVLRDMKQLESLHLRFWAPNVQELGAKMNELDHLLRDVLSRPHLLKTLTVSTLFVDIEGPNAAPLSIAPIVRRLRAFNVRLKDLSIL